MAITRQRQTIHMTATSDEVEGTVILQAVVCDAATTLTDSAGTVIFKSGGATTLALSKPISVDGVVMTAGTTVTLYV